MGPHITEREAMRSNASHLPQDTSCADPTSTQQALGSAGARGIGSTTPPPSNYQSPDC